MKIAPVAVAPPEPPRPDEKRRLHDAATQFEAVFLKQLLAAAKVTPTSGHGSLALDALADGIAGAGGIGLARSVEEAAQKALEDGVRKSPKGR